jgi:hypothetical protein
MSDIIFETDYADSFGQSFRIEIYNPKYYTPCTTLMVRIHNLNEYYGYNIFLSSIKSNDIFWQNIFNSEKISEDYPIELKYYIEKIVKLQAFF